MSEILTIVATTVIVFATTEILKMLLEKLKTGRGRKRK
jgi:hypothetical protein